MKINRKIKSLIIVLVLLFLVLGAGTLFKNILLNQLKGKIQPTLSFSRLYLSFFPPALVLEDVRSRTSSPFFSAKKISVSLPYQSLLSREKLFNVHIEHPVLRIYPASFQGYGKGKSKIGLIFPFAVKKGLITEGELYYWGNNVRFQSQKFDALFNQKKDQFSLQADGESCLFSMGSRPHTIEGRVNLLLEGRGKDIQVKRAVVSGPDGYFKAEGNVPDLLDPEFEISCIFGVQADLVADMLNLPFTWQGKAEGKGVLTRKNGQIGFNAGFSSQNLLLNGVQMGAVAGGVDFNEKSGGSVDFNAQRPGYVSEHLKIDFKENRIQGTAERFHLDPILKYAALPWPVSSPVWGTFSIREGYLTADAEFRDDVTNFGDGRYPFQGRVKFDWDGKDKFSFSSLDLQSSFSRVDVYGKFQTGKSVEIDINGTVKDVKQAREFTSLILQKQFDFPEIRGKGLAEIKIYGSFDSPQVEAKFSLSPGGFDRFDALSVKGDAELIKNDFLGQFQVEDPRMKGKIGVVTHAEEVKIEIHLESGFLEKILPLLDILLPLKGQASGNFEFRQQRESQKLTGNFSSSAIEFGGQPLTQVRGSIDWDGATVSFPEFEFGFHGGKIGGFFLLNLLARSFDLDIKGGGVNLSTLYKGMEGELSFDLRGKGLFGQDFVTGSFDVSRLHLTPFQETAAEGKARIGFTEKDIALELDGNFIPGDNSFHVSLNVPFQEDFISGKIRGSFSNLDLLVPWKGAKGQIDYLAEIKGSKLTPHLKGAIDFQGSVLPFPQFAHALRDYSGLVFVDDGNFSLRSLQGMLGGGQVKGSGRLHLGTGGIKEFEINVEGEKMLLSPLERTRALADGSMTLLKDAQRFLLEGDFFIHKLSWRREVTERFSFSSSSTLQVQREPGYFDDLNVNIHLKAADDAWMENSLGTVRGKFDLSILGNVNAPIVLGDIEALGGEVYFQDRKFNILKGTLSFLNPSSIEPYLSFKGETFVKDYHVNFSLDGPVEHLTPEFSSSPPLPPEDVLALLALGESFKRTYQYDKSTQLSTASLLSFQLSEEAKKRAESLFQIDRFRIDPFIVGTSAEMTARLTLGKKISRNFFILYSTNLTTQREEIMRIEWELTNDLSVVGTRDEKGRVSIDVKIHKRF